MKYIKTFEKREISEDERKLKNLARRLEYNLNKFFKPAVDKNNYEFIVVYGYYHNMSNSESIRITLHNISKESSEFLVFWNKFHELGGKYFISFDLDKEKAEKLLLSLKKELPERVMEIDMKKYNL